MTRDDAVKRIKKLLGAKAVCQDNGRQTNPEDRQKAKAHGNEAREQVKRLKAAIDARRRAVLEADAEYTRLCQERTALENGWKNAPWGGYRIMVGLDTGFALQVCAEGDNWAEAVRATEKYVAAGSLASQRVS